jgi:UPF0716 protein FxsA
LLVAAVTLLTPGLVTDLVGFLLVVPFTRYPIRLAVKKWVVVPYADAKSRGFVTGNVWVGGFPDEEGAPGPGGRPGPGSPGPGSGGAGGDTYDLDEDAYDVDDDRE